MRRVSCSSRWTAPQVRRSSRRGQSAAAGALDLHAREDRRQPPGSRPGGGRRAPRRRCAHSRLASRGVLRHVLGEAGEAPLGGQAPMYASRIAAVFDLFPGAHFLNVVRDPRACIASPVTQAELVRRKHRSVVELWERSLRSVDAMRGSLAPDQLLDIQYEELVLDPEATLERVTGFIWASANEDAMAQMLRYYEVKETRSARSTPISSDRSTPRGCRAGRSRSRPRRSRSWRRRPHRHGAVGLERVAEGVAAPDEASGKRSPPSARRRPPPAAGSSPARSPAEARHPPASARRPPQRLHRCCHGSRRTGSGIPSAAAEDGPDEDPSGRC